MKHLKSGLLVVAAGIGLTALALTATTIVHAQSATGDVEVPASAVVTGVTTIPTTTSTTTPTIPDHEQRRLNEMASLLGMTPTDLQNELQSGKPFYQIAAEHGVTYDKLQAQRETQFKARLDDMVKVGYLTQAEANTMLQQYQTQAQQMPMGGMGFGHHGFGF